jgi:hypothetical protein
MLWELRMSMLTYIYIYEDEIDRLYAQHVEWVISQRLQSDKKILKGGVSAKVMGIGADVGGNKETEYTDKKELSFATKVKQIKSALESSDNLYLDIRETFDILKTGQGVYIDTKMHFIVPQFKEDNATDLVNRERHVVLESQVDEYIIIMSLGLENMPRLRGRSMSKTCHDAILFREIADQGFDFSIFGSLNKISAHKLQIRPIVVAL